MKQVCACGRREFGRCTDCAQAELEAPMFQPELTPVQTTIHFTPPTTTYPIGPGPALSLLESAAPGWSVIGIVLVRVDAFLQRVKRAAQGERNVA